MYGYRPDPVSTKDQNGSPLVGNFSVQVWNQTLPDNGFDSFKAMASTIHAGDVDLSRFTTETNQYYLQSCAGNATADSLEILNAIAGKPAVQLSRLFVYSMARIMAGELSKDKGSYLRLCFETLSRFGICREDDQVNGWPYDSSKIFVAPSIMAMRQATGHKISSYYRIRSEGEDRLADIISALRANHPVVFGTSITSDFEQLTGSGPVAPPIGKPTVGGHAMTCVGFDSQRGFLIKNSWGRAWGQDGFCYMTPEYMTFKDTADLWVPTTGIAFNPTDPT